MKPRRGPTAIVVLVLVVLVTASPALVPHRSAGAPSVAVFAPLRPTRVLVLGDSVMKGAADAYQDALPGREVDAEVSRSTSAGADQLDRLGEDWDVVVVLLGHNDGGSAAVYQPAARRLLDRLRHVPRVSWLTLHEVRPSYRDVNQFLLGLRNEYPNLRIGDWNQVASANPAALVGDGLHLNRTGSALMAEIVASQVAVAEWEFTIAFRALTATPTTPTTTITTPSTTTPSTTTPSTTTPSIARPATPEPADAGDDAGPRERASVAADDVGDRSRGTGPLVSAAAIGLVSVAVAGAAWSWRVRRTAGGRAGRSP